MCIVRIEWQRRYQSESGRPAASAAAMRSSAVATSKFSSIDTDRGGDGSSAPRGSANVGERAADVASPKLVIAAVAAIGSNRMYAGVVQPAKSH